MASTPGENLPTAPPALNIPRVIVATTAMLSFISFWRAAAIVLNDMGSSAFYAGAIAEAAFGKSAPWGILLIMLFAYPVFALYIESCSMFVRGGVYRTVKEGMGGTLAKVSVSALMFDFILTGPISGVSAGHYLTGFLNEIFRSSGLNLTLPTNLTAAFFAILVTLYFWWQKRQRHSGVQRQGASHHVRDHTHGRDHDRLVPVHPLGARRPAPAVADTLQSHIL